MHAEKPAANPAINPSIFVPQNEQRSIVPPVLTLPDIQTQDHGGRSFGYTDAFNVNNCNT